MQSIVFHATMIIKGVDQDGNKGEFTVYSIPQVTWAVFESVDPMPETIQKVWQRIFTEWLPATGYEIVHGPQLELYTPGDNSAKDYLNRKTVGLTLLCVRLFFMACPRGFEPPLPWSVAKCSIQLSHGHISCFSRLIVMTHGSCAHPNGKIYTNTNPEKNQHVF